MEITEMFEILRGDIRGVNTRIERLEEKVDERFVRFEEKVDERLVRFEEQVHARLLQNEDKLERRITEVKADLGQRVSDVRTDLGKRLDAVNERIDEVRVDIRDASSRRVQAWTAAVGSATALAVASTFVLQLYLVLR